MSASPARDRVVRETWQMLREVVLDSSRGKATVSAELGLSFSRARALPRLLNGPLTLRKLAESLSTDPPYATLIVDDLQQRGLVQRQPHPEDGRAKLVVLTEAGAAVARRVVEILDTVPQQFGALDAADLESLHAVLVKLAASPG